jgi:hypothetical protein
MPIIYKYLISALLLACTLMQSQTKIKYETVFFEESSVENANAKITLSNAISEKDFIKGKVKVTNYTGKALVIKPEECSYSTPVGEIFSKDKWMVIGPRQQETKTIDVKGDNLKTDKTSFKINGFYICNTVETVNAPDMQLPPQEELTIGNFKLKLDGWDRDGKEIMIKYNIRYMGDKVGMMDPGKVLLKSPGGTEYKNQKDKEKIYAFNKKEDFLIGFLYLSDSKKENVLLWKDAFSEGTPEKTESVTIETKMDLPKTKEKN